MAAIVATALPDVDLQPNSVITVTLADAGAKITSLVVHGWQDTGDETVQVEKVGPSYFAGEATV
jgi:hypothetical protein